jgi:hypothetical protein
MSRIYMEALFAAQAMRIKYLELLAMPCRSGTTPASGGGLSRSKIVVA